MSEPIKKFPNKILELFSPPDNLDYEQNQRYLILQYSLFVAAFALLVTGFINWLNGSFHFAYVLFVTFLSIIFGIFLNNRGKRTLAGMLLIIGVFFSTIYALIIKDGLSDPGILVFPMLILIGAFIFGRIGLIATFLGSEISIYSLMFMHENGLIRLNGTPSLDQTFLISLLLLVSGTFSWGVVFALDKSREERNRSETRYRNLFENSPIPLWEIDASALNKFIFTLLETGTLDLRSYFADQPGNIQACARMVTTLSLNQAMVELTGFSTREGLIANIYSTLTNRAYQVFKEAIVTLAAGEHFYEAESLIKKIDERNVNVQMRLVIPEGYESNWSRIYISFTDITQRINTEIKLKESEARYRTQAHATFEGIMITKNGVIVDVNEQITSMLLFSTDEIIGKHTINFMPKEEHARIMDNIISGEERIGEYKLIKKDGSQITVEAHGQEYEIDGEKFRVSSFRDITARKLAEESICKSEQKFSEAFYSNTAIMAISTIEGGRFIEVNETFLSVFGYDCDEVIGHTVEELGLWDDFSQRKALINTLEPSEVKFRGKDRQLIICSAAFREIFIGEERCILTTAIDITEKKQVEEDLRIEVARSNALAHTAARLNTQLDLDGVFELICEEIVKIMKAQAAAIFVKDPQQDLWKIGAGYGLPIEFVRQYQPVPQSKLLVNNPSSLEPVISILDADVVNSEYLSRFQVEKLISIKMHQLGNYFGVVEVFFNEKGRVFSEGEVSLIKALTELGTQAMTNAKLYQEVLQGKEHLQQLSQQLIEVQEAERRSLALELHDELGQVLNGIKISLDMISLNSDISRNEKLLIRSRSAIGNLIESVRKMSLDLRPSMLDEMGLYPTLTWFFRSYQEQTDALVKFQWNGPKSRFKSSVEITAYRIIQEALNNIMRHASDKQAAVDIRVDDIQLNIQIIDHGGGFDVDKALSVGKSTGLSGMRERAHLLGGDFTIESYPEIGTTISANLPLADSSNRDK